MKKDRVLESVDSPKGVGDNVVLSRLEMLECQSGAAVLRNGQVCRMRPPIRRRVLGSEISDCCYHVMSRTVGAERILDDEDLEALRIIIRKIALFSGVKVMTYCLLQRLFHIWTFAFNNRKGNAIDKQNNIGAIVFFAFASHYVKFFCYMKYVIR